MPQERRDFGTASGSGVLNAIFGALARKQEQEDQRQELLKEVAILKAKSDIEKQAGLEQISAYEALLSGLGMGGGTPMGGGAPEDKTRSSQEGVSSGLEAVGLAPTAPKPTFSPTPSPTPLARPTPTPSSQPRYRMKNFNLPIPGGGSMALESVPSEAEFQNEMQRKLRETVMTTRAKKAAEGSSPPEAVTLASSKSVYDSVSSVLADAEGQLGEEFAAAVRTQSMGTDFGRFARMFAKAGLSKESKKILKNLDTILVEYVQSKGGKQLTQTEIMFITRTMPDWLDDPETQLMALKNIRDISARVMERINGSESLGLIQVENGAFIDQYGNEVRPEEIDQALGLPPVRGIEIGQIPAPDLSESELLRLKSKGAARWDDVQGTFVDAQGNEVDWR